MAETEAGCGACDHVTEAECPSDGCVSCHESRNRGLTHTQNITRLFVLANTTPGLDMCVIAIILFCRVGMKENNI